MDTALHTAKSATFTITQARTLQAVKLATVEQGCQQEKAANSLSVSTCIEGIQETSSRAEKLIARNACRKQRMRNLEDRTQAWKVRIRKYTDLHKQWTLQLLALR